MSQSVYLFGGCCCEDQEEWRFQVRFTMQGGEGGVVLSDMINVEPFSVQYEVIDDVGEFLWEASGFKVTRPILPDNEFSVTGYRVPQLEFFASSTGSALNDIAGPLLAFGVLDSEDHLHTAFEGVAGRTYLNEGDVNGDVLIGAGFFTGSDLGGILISRLRDDAGTAGYFGSAENGRLFFIPDGTSILVKGVVTRLPPPV
jgi:hypothetical protein